MKRFLAGTLAVATAFSLSTGVAGAMTSSEVSDEYLETYSRLAGYVEGQQKGAGLTSSMRDIMLNYSGNESDYGSLYSSMKNDAANGYRLGTTMDILIGTGVTAVVLGAIIAAIQSGVIQLPF